MSDEEKEYWDKNIKPNNSKIQLFISRVRWKFYLAGAWLKRRKILGIGDVTWSMEDIYKIVYVMMILACVSIFLNMIMDVLMFIYPRLRWYSPEDLANNGYEFLKALMRN